MAITVDGAPLTVDTRKAVALLAYLAVLRRPVGRETMAALLWPESDGPDSKGALRRTLSVLRAGLDDVGLSVDRSTMALRELDADVDLWRFRAALALARGHDHPGADTCADCLATLEDAGALDRGEFMEGFALRDSEPFDEWQLAEAEAYRRDRSAVLERLARGHAAARSWDQAASATRRWLELDPLHEPSHRLLMEILARSGEPAAAIAQYRECVRILDRELGVAPLEETTELVEAIRAGRLAPAPPAAALTSLTGSAASDGTLTAGPDRRSRSLRPTPLVGREREISALTAALDGIGPAGQLLVIEGEPGIGKTRLAASVAEIVRTRGGVAVEARAYAGEAAIPFSVVVELLRAVLGRAEAHSFLATVDPFQLSEVVRLVPIPGVDATPSDGSATLGDPFGRVRLFQALAIILAGSVAGPQPGLIAIDDLHLADASSLEFIGYLVRRLADHPIGLLVTWRPEDVPEGVRHRLLEPAPDERPARIAELGRLGPGDVAELAAAILDGPPTPSVLDALVAESEGLPLYVVEALAAPAIPPGATPVGVLALLRSRVAATTDVAHQLLAAAAVIGRSFDPVLVRTASGRSEDETVNGLEELVRRGLIREVGDPGGGDLRLDFTHGRLRDVVYDDLSLTRRRLLHGRVGDALAADLRLEPDGRTRWSLIAYHHTLAGRGEAAADAHGRAGADARAVFANEEAREHLEAALALGHPNVAALHGDLGEVLILLGDYEAALFHLESAAALAGPADQAVLEHRMGMIHARRGDWARVDGHLVAALAATDDVALRSRVLADRSAVVDRSGDPVGARALATEALELADSVRDPIGVARARDLLGILARRRGDLAVARRELEFALATLDSAERPGAPHAAGDPGVRIAALNSLALVLADDGDPDRAIDLTTQALLLCSRQGDRHRQAALENNLADLLHVSGRHDEAMEHLKRAVALFAEVGGRPGELEPEIWKLVEW